MGRCVLQRSGSGYLKTCSLANCEGGGSDGLHCWTETLLSCKGKEMLPDMDQCMASVRCRKCLVFLLKSRRYQRAVNRQNGKALGSALRGRQGPLLLPRSTATGWTIDNDQTRHEGIRTNLYCLNVSILRYTYRSCRRVHSGSANRFSLNHCHCAWVS